MTSKLTNAQLEILKIFSSPMSKKQLKKFKAYLLEYRAKELSELVDQKFEEMGTHPDELLKEHLRSPYTINNPS